MRNIASFSVVLLAGTSAAWAADLTKVDRTIRHEPAYQSKAPSTASWYSARKPRPRFGWWWTAKLCMWTRWERVI